MALKKLEKQHAQALKEIGDEAEKETIIAKHQDEIEQRKTEFNERKKQGLSEIKDKFNDLCKQVNVDTKEVVNLIQAKKLQQQETALEEEKDVDYDEDPYGLNR